jgi:hypothetical protein
LNTVGKGGVEDGAFGWIAVGLVLDVERVKAERKIKTDLAALRYLAESPSRYNGHKPSRKPFHSTLV